VVFLITSRKMSEYYNQLGHDCSLLRLPNWLLTNISAFDVTFFPWCNSVSWARTSSISTLHTLTLRHHAQQDFFRRGRVFYLITHNTHNGQTSMSPAGFEPSIPASERPQTHALDHASTRLGFDAIY